MKYTTSDSAGFRSTSATRVSQSARCRVTLRGAVSGIAVARPPPKSSSFNIPCAGFNGQQVVLEVACAWIAEDYLLGFWTLNGVRIMPALYSDDTLTRQDRIKINTLRVLMQYLTEDKAKDRGSSSAAQKRPQSYR